MSQDKHNEAAPATLSLVPVRVGDDTIDAGRADDGTVWVSVKRVCDALGITTQAQTRKLSEKRWSRISAIATPTPGGVQITYCIPLRSLPMWLATIETARVREEVRARLELLQLEAVHVLAKHFLKYDESITSSYVNARSVEPYPAAPPFLPPDVISLRRAELLDKFASDLATVVSPESIAVLRAHGAAALTGEPVKFFLPVLASPKWYRPTEIAKMFNVSPNHIGRTITRLGLREHPEHSKAILDAKANGAGQVKCFLYDARALDMIRDALADTKK